MKPAFTKHKNDNSGNCASIPRWMAKWYPYYRSVKIYTYLLLNLKFKGVKLN